VRPRELNPRAPVDLHRARLGQQLDMRHPLVQLAALIAWDAFERQFGEL